MAALEFCLPRAELPALLKLPLFGRGSRATPCDRIWHDTQGGELAEAGLSLCETKDGWRLEASHPAAGQPWPPGVPAPLLAAAPDLAQVSEAAGRALPQPLISVAGFHGRQRVMPVTGHSAADASLTILDGVIRGVAQERPVCRLILQGPAPMLLDLSTALSHAAPISVPRWSLASEAIALAGTRPPLPRRTGAPQITPGTSLSDAIANVLGHLADVIIAGSSTAADGHSPEPVHQMRVAVRRLRSALSVFKRAAGPADSVKPGLKRLAAVLGGARDWDVFLLGTGASLTAALPDDRRVAAMLATAVRHRAQAYRELQRLLNSPEFRQAEVQLAVLAALRPWEAQAAAEQEERLQADAADYASHRLQRRLEIMLAPGDDIATLPVGDLHAIRKEGKRLRYACEFFAPLFGRKAPRRFIERLVALQEALGHLNDTASAGILMASLGARADRQYAAGVVQGYIAAGAGGTRREIERAWDRFRRQEPFWT